MISDILTLNTTDTVNFSVSSYDYMFVWSVLHVSLLNTDHQQHLLLWWVLIRHQEFKIKTLIRKMVDMLYHYDPFGNSFCLFFNPSN